MRSTPGRPPRPLSVRTLLIIALALLGLLRAPAVRADEPAKEPHAEEPHAAKDPHADGANDPQDAAKLLESIRGQIKSHPLRQAYEGEVAKLAERAKALAAAGKPVAEIARTMHQARRDLGVKYKNVTPELLREYIYDVNRGRYGDPLGPSFEYLVKKNTARDGTVNYQSIVESSCRPNGDVDKLLAGFEDWLRAKGKIK